MTIKTILILLIFVSGIAIPQKKDPEKVLDEVKRTFNKVNDYVVDVNIRVDVVFLKVPETNATIYYKQPGKMHLESEGFALLPKEGMDFSPVGLLDEEYTSIYEKTDTVDGHRTDVIKVIPLSENSDVVLTTLWIDESRHIIRKVESSPKIGGTFSIELNYDDSKTDYPLPTKMLFTFNIDRMNLPKGMAGELNQSKSKDEKKSKSTTGKVFINYKSYKVNQGIPDSVFEEKEK
jgi:outer membrane lipoprotein-sorting protein